MYFTINSMCAFWDKLVVARCIEKMAFFFLWLHISEQCRIAFYTRMIRHVHVSLIPCNIVSWKCINIIDRIRRIKVISETNIFLRLKIKTLHFWEDLVVMAIFCTVLIAFRRRPVYKDKENTRNQKLLYVYRFFLYWIIFYSFTDHF